ncbi:class I mannose-6-phosphate isomerase [Sphingobium sp.]|uniref:class I mannose-6-phosphate isomerase n=1 Tax=Sphingobium sp. TaxID=1912891 RepID=UPI002CF86B5C|nr:class I mannose-6-phosphate isomerase [Sphingobium sp.]HUD93073.1 class I mannose-6-phosphate isomerase [Sphingobium sp.]
MARAVRQLQPRLVEKPWGREALPPLFGPTGGTPIGEIWFEDEASLSLLVKYIFTSERLSIQVHPDDAAARASGLPRGKEEIWYILDCEPGATLGIGLKRPTTPQDFRLAALDGSIEDMIDWKAVQPGDCYFIPAGTVHAIGAGIVLAEIQQNADITYRLYDYGRPRELHLDQGLSVSLLEPYRRPVIHAPIGTKETTLTPDGAPFTLTLCHWDIGAMTLPATDQLWFTPLDGHGTINGANWSKGECWLLDGQCLIEALAPTSALLATSTRI